MSGTTKNCSVRKGDCNQLTSNVHHLVGVPCSRKRDEDLEKEYRLGLNPEQDSAVMA
jgi:hypothetical protein